MSHSATPPPFFQTANCKLATVLALAGVPWLDPNEPVEVEYDADYLDSVNCRTVKEARAKGKPGRYIFKFRPVPALKECLQAFDRANAHVDALMQSGGEVPFLEKLSPQDRADIVATALKVESLVNDSRFSCPYFMVFHKDGEPVTVKNDDGSTTVINPGFKRVRSDAPESLKKEMSL